MELFNVLASEKSWYAISVTVAPDAAEAVEHAFNSLNSLGTEINHLKKKNSESLTVIGYFDELPDEQTVEDELHYSLKIYGLSEDSVQQLERSTIDDADWLSEWKKHWKPTAVGNFVIAPPWSDVPEDAKILIRIEPNMAFGTGTHETTQLCLRAIEKYYVPGDSFLDVGTGTGILAIAAAKISLRSRISIFESLACDTDAASVALAKENAGLNDVVDAIEFVEGPISETTPEFEFVCANLTLDVIEPILPLLIAKAGKTLVLSGILAQQRNAIVEALEDLDIRDCEVDQAGEWICLVVS